MKKTSRNQLIGGTSADSAEAGNKRGRSKFSKTRSHAGPGKPPREDFVTYKAIALPHSLREKVQKAADKEVGGVFSALVERAFKKFLDDPNTFTLEPSEDGPRKNKALSLPVELIDAIQAQADRLTKGNFSGLAQKILLGYLKNTGYTA